jgi:hypothetical protein
LQKKVDTISMNLPPIKQRMKKVAVNVMLPPATKEKLDRVSRTHNVPRGDYIDRALQAAFKEDGVK